jgi:hypothetical protein
VAVHSKTFDVNKSEDVDIDGVLYLERHLPSHVSKHLEGHAQTITVEVLFCPECKAVFGEITDATGLG